MFPSRWLVALALLCPTAGLAHSFGQVYTPPIPFWMYAWGASGALLISFLLFGAFLREPVATPATRQRIIPLPARSLLLLSIGRLLSVLILILCIATGLIGEPSPYGNFNMTFIWIVFALGGLYLAALIGDFYAGLNPWRVVADSIGRFWPAYKGGWLDYPAAWGYWPALLLYMGFIWVELFAHNTPASLARLLLGYSALNLLGAGLFGLRNWFTYGEFFSVMFRLVGSLAPLQWRREKGQAQLLIQPPFMAATQPADRVSLLLFILFMLSSTAFDGLKETLLWQRLFWVELYHAGLKDYAGINPLAAVPQMREWARWWHSAWLLLSPWLYFLIYALFIALSKALAGSSRPWRQLMLDFATSLLPIALVYHVTHYYTLIQAQGVKIVQLASDPFGWGWNLFGTADWLQRSIVPDPDVVWHVQVVLIVVGHIVSVYLAHRVALRVFPSHRQALLSQIPMLLLMLAFTAAGLWILSLPTLN